MKPEDFLEQHQCKFSVSERDQNLCKRVEQYFKDTDKAGFHVSIAESKKLKKWAENNGFSRVELQKAKSMVDRYLPKQD